jgi:hypothetical protein
MTRKKKAGKVFPASFDYRGKILHCAQEDTEDQEEAGIQTERSPSAFRSAV